MQLHFPVIDTRYSLKIAVVDRLMYIESIFTRKNAIKTCRVLVFCVKVKADDKSRLGYLENTVYTIP